MINLSHGPLSSFTQRRWVFAIVLFALMLRLAGAGYWQVQSLRGGELLRFGDSHSYWTMASNLAHRGTFQYGSSDSKVFRAPLYPLLLAPWTLIQSDGPTLVGVLAVRCIGCLLGAWTVWLIIQCGNLLAGARTGMTAGILSAVYPGAIGMSVFVLSEAIATPLMVASLFFTLRSILALERRRSAADDAPTKDAFPLGSNRVLGFGTRWGWQSMATLAGICFGLTCLARPSWSLWPAVLFLYVASMGRGFPRIPALICWQWMLLFSIGLVGTMSPWWIRNFSITGKFVPTTLQVGASLYDGWHPGATGSSDENMDFVLGFLVDQKREDELLAKQSTPLESTFEWRADRRMRIAAIAWAFENPSDVMRLGLLKLRRTWAPMPSAREVGQPWIRWSEGLGYGVLVLLAGYGAWLGRRERGLWLMLIPCLYIAILHAIFIGSVRYRQPGVLMLCPVAGLGCASIIEWIQRRIDGTRFRNTEWS